MSGDPLQYVVVPSQLFGPRVDFSLANKMIASAGYGPMERNNDPILQHFRYDPVRIANRVHRGTFFIRGITGIFGTAN